jgi:hypothetical protein
MKPVKRFFLNLALFNHAILSDVTYERVTFSLSLSRAWTTAAAVDFTDAAGLPLSPLALELRSSTSPKVMDHF